MASLSEHMTRRDGVEAAMSVAEDLSAGRLDPADVEHQAVEACRELFGVVVGPDDPIWGLQVEVCRGVLAARGIPAAELREYAAVQQRFEDTPVAEKEIEVSCADFEFDPPATRGRRTSDRGHPRVAPRGVATGSRNTRVGVEEG
jgi:hypothetical protein